MQIKLEINGKEIEAVKGETILAALNRSGIHVPTICSMKDLIPSGACRMCVVEVEGREKLVPACSFPVEEPMKIKTHSPRVLKARKTNVELLLSNHPDDCLYCERNGSCELQSLAEDLNIRERNIPGKRRAAQPDRSSPAIVRDVSKCILCGRCVRVCEEIMKVSAFDFAHRGNELKVSTTLAKPLNFSSCVACGQCLIACPTGALIENVRFPELSDYIHSPDTTMVAQVTPAVAVSVAEQLGYKSGTDFSRMINAALRQCGFDYVFETSAGADIMIMEQAGILNRRKSGRTGVPLLTSSCPAWVRYVEQFLPELIPHLSPLKSPHQITSSLVKEMLAEQKNDDRRNIVSVVISSCIAAKNEAQRVETATGDHPVIELVITTRELARMIRLSGIDLNRLEPEEPDLPFHCGGSGSMLTAVAGGEAEATIRTLYRQITRRELTAAKLHRFRVHRSVREMVVSAGEREFRLGAVSGLANAVELIEEITSGKRSFDLLEVMACPDGCVNGGGQPHSIDNQIIRSRTKSIYEIENSESPVN